MGTQTHSRKTASQDDDGGTSSPYPLNRGDIGFWLRRGEQLGRAACWIAATLAAGQKRAAQWVRHAASKHLGHGPSQPS